MAEWQSTEGYWSVVCRVCGVDRRTSLLSARRAWEVRDRFECEARAAGWRLFVSRSGRRWYCPSHGPSNGHRMHEVTR